MLNKTAGDSMDMTNNLSAIGRLTGAESAEKQYEKSIIINGNEYEMG